MIVKVQGNGHANLDSFPFRYGFTYGATERLELTNVRNKSEVVDNRYHVDASFKNNVLRIRIPKTERVRTRIIKIEES